MLIIYNMLRYTCSITKTDGAKIKRANSNSIHKNKISPDNLITVSISVPISSEKTNKLK